MRDLGEIIVAFVRDYRARYGTGPTQTAIVHHVRDRAVDDVRAALERMKEKGRLNEAYSKDLGVRVTEREQPATGTTGARVYKPKACAACTSRFTPTGPRARYCQGAACPATAA